MAGFNFTDMPILFQALQLKSIFVCSFFSYTGEIKQERNIIHIDRRISQQKGIIDP